MRKKVHFLAQIYVEGHHGSVENCSRRKATKLWGGVIVCALFTGFGCALLIRVTDFDDRPAFVQVDPRRQRNTDEAAFSRVLVREIIYSKRI